MCEAEEGSFQALAAVLDEDSALQPAQDVFVSQRGVGADAHGDGRESRIKRDKGTRRGGKKAAAAAAAKELVSGARNLDEGLVLLLDDSSGSPVALDIAVADSSSVGRELLEYHCACLELSRMISENFLDGDRHEEADSDEEQHDWCSAESARERVMACVLHKRLPVDIRTANASNLSCVLTECMPRALYAPEFTPTGMSALRPPLGTTTAREVVRHFLGKYARGGPKLSGSGLDLRLGLPMLQACLDLEDA